MNFLLCSILALMQYFVAQAATSINLKGSSSALSQQSYLEHFSQVKSQSISGPIPKNPTYFTAWYYKDPTCANTNFTAAASVILDTCLVSGGLNKHSEMYTCTDGVTTLTEYRDANCTIATFSNKTIEGCSRTPGTDLHSYAAFQKTTCGSGNAFQGWANGMPSFVTFEDTKCSKDVIAARGFRDGVCIQDTTQSVIFNGLKNATGYPNHICKPPSTFTVSLNQNCKVQEDTVSDDDITAGLASKWEIPNSAISTKLISTSMFAFVSFLSMYLL